MKINLQKIYNYYFIKILKLFNNRLKILKEFLILQN